MKMKSGAKVVAPVQRASGGKAPQVVSGNKNVLKEAEEETTGDEDKLKKGGRAKKKAGGKVMKMEGGKVTARADKPARQSGGGIRPPVVRPGRKAGGGVGANASPLSTAHNATSTGAGSSNPTDTYGGTPK